MISSGSDLGPWSSLAALPHPSLLSNEMEIGMTHCFGGFTREFYKAYHEVYPKAEPAEYYDQRIELYKVR